jgi:hypothetical protein
MGLNYYSTIFSYVYTRLLIEIAITILVCYFNTVIAHPYKLNLISVNLVRIDAVWLKFKTLERKKGTKYDENITIEVNSVNNTEILLIKIFFFSFFDK